MERHDMIITLLLSVIYSLGDPNSYLKMLLYLICSDSIDQWKILGRFKPSYNFRTQGEYGNTRGII